MEWGWCWGQSLGTGLIIFLGRYATVFQPEIYAILACVYRIQMNIRSDKYISICSTVKQLWQLFRLLKHPNRYRSAKGCYMTFAPLIFWDMWKWNCPWAHKGELCSPVFGPEPALGILRQNIKKKIKRWLVNQHMILWQGLTSMSKVHVHQEQKVSSPPSILYTISRS